MSINVYPVPIQTVDTSDIKRSNELLKKQFLELKLNNLYNEKKTDETFTHEDIEED